jgi:hypothetical protein
MYVSVFHILPHLGRKHSRLLWFPAQDARKEGQRHGLHPGQASSLSPHAQLFSAAVLGPWVRRPLEDLLLHVNEADGFHHVFEFVRHGAGTPYLFGRFDQQVGPSQDGCALGHGVVVAADGEGVVV